MGDSHEASRVAGATQLIAERAVGAEGGTVDCAGDEDPPTSSAQPTAEQLMSVLKLVFKELHSADQTPIQAEMPLDHKLQKKGDQDARVTTGGEHVACRMVCGRFLGARGKDASSCCAVQYRCFTTVLKLRSAEQHQK